MVRQKKIPKKTIISQKRRSIFCCIFHQLMTGHISEMFKFYYDTRSTNKIMAVWNAKCHFVSEQELISTITRNRYHFNYYKETRHTDASNINSDNMFEMSTATSVHAWGLLRNGSIASCINWAPRQVSPDRLKNGPHIRSVGRLWCVTLPYYVGTYWALHPIRDNHILPWSKYVSKFVN